MKKIFVVLLCLLVQMGYGQKLQPLLDWHQAKFSLFIHYGLYSLPAGYWDGEKVEQGYSEQIYSFAKLNREQYAQLLPRFKAEKWNADEIVSLASEAGMKSVVMTAKHHDGFCLYRSDHTDYNVYDATPAKRDLLAELAQACRKKGMHMGIYFSLIDWHFPEASPLSPHNADAITPAHHQYNLRQVEELLTRYGSISELWFDMGSLTPEQSRELYELVHRLQPNCMVSGRLGNDYADFAVMGDNELPSEKLLLPWQTAASMFKETWGYRQWQERGSAKAKAWEKFEELIQVVGRGGNYLLNVGPHGNGSVIPFEREVLAEMGTLMQQFGEALYASEGSPFAEIQPYGEFTRRGNTLYLFLHQDYYDKVIKLPIKGAHLEMVGNLSNNAQINLNVQDDYVQMSVAGKYRLGEAFHAVEQPYMLISFEFEEDGSPWQQLMLSEEPSAQHYPLHVGNSERLYAHSSWDYYSGFKSIIAMQWRMNELPTKLCYSEHERGQKLWLEVNGKLQELKLDAGTKQKFVVDQSKVHYATLYGRRVGGVFGYLPEAMLGEEPIDFTNGWETCPQGALEREASPIYSYLLAQEIECDEALIVPCKLYYGNGVYVSLNGKQINAVLEREPRQDQELLLQLPLKKGKNRLLIRYFNRFEDKLRYGIKWEESYETYTMELDPKLMPATSEPGSLNVLKVSRANPELKSRPLNRPNLRLLE